MEQANRMVGASAIGAAMLIGLCTPSAQAAFIVDLTQEGSNVVATGSGTIDLTDLSLFVPLLGHIAGSIEPNQGLIEVGPMILTDGEFYTGITGPTNFGDGSRTFASSGSGDSLGVVGAETALVVVPEGYVSGTALSDSTTFDSATFASLGVRPGTYTWTWGSGVNADSFTLKTTVVPEPSTWAMMALGFAGLGFLGYRKTRSALA
jgi:PEP-CTERM motif